MAVKLKLLNLEGHWSFLLTKILYHVIYVTTYKCFLIFLLFLSTTGGRLLIAVD